MARIWDIFLDLSGAGFGHHDAPSGPAPCARRNVAGLAKSKGSPRTMAGLGGPAKSVDAGPRFTTGERGGYSPTNGLVIGDPAGPCKASAAEIGRAHV